MRFKNETHAWVMWSMSYFTPEIWIGEIWGGTHLYEHFLGKFKGIMERYESSAVMNTFYCQLSDGNAEKLRDWVIDVYANENWPTIRKELSEKYK